MMRNFLKFIVILCTSFIMIVPTAYAVVQDGQVSKSLMGIFGEIGSMFSGICLVVGIGLIFASFIQYRQHRANKLLVPISKPIFLLVLGIFLACVPILGHYTQGGRLVAQVGGSDDV